MRGLEARASRGERALEALCLAALLVPLLVLAALAVEVVREGLPRLGWEFLSGFPSRRAEGAGFLPAIVGSLWLMVLTAALALPVGVAAAVYLEEYAPPGRLTWLIEVNIANLAGVPSIVYGLLGLGLFVRALRLDRSLLAGAATLALLVLPMIILVSREALRAVPASLREGALALGADRWAVVRGVVLPLSLPGILTGVVLALARAMGETAPLITIGAVAYVAFLPDGPRSSFTAMPIQVFNWVSRPQPAFHANAAAGIVVLLVVLGLLNGVALALRLRLNRRSQW